MASPFSPSSQSPPPPPHRRSALPTAVPESEQQQQQQQQEEESHVEATAVASAAYRHRPTPLHAATHSSKTTAPKKTHPTNSAGDHVIFGSKCRPSVRERISVVPLDAACGGGGHGKSRSSSSVASPGHNSVLKSLLNTLVRRSPRPSTCTSPAAVQPHAAALAGEDEWRLVATELSHRLIHAIRKRDEALAEASRLKYSVSELQKKLAGIESYCRDLKFSVDHCHRNHQVHHLPAAAAVGSSEFPLESFLRAVSDARSAVRHLSRSLSAQMRQAGNPPKAHDRISQLPQKQEAPGAAGTGGSGILLQLEAMVSRAFYEDFETAGFQRGGADRILDPRARAEANWVSYTALRGLSWEDVLSRGTRHYSEGFSQFCDRKMGEVAGAAMGGASSGAWPEPLLRAFFGAAKGVWLVHRLAWCGNPPVAVFRVAKGTPFDPAYMEDVAAAAAGRGRRPTPEPAAVRVMVAPGFYVQGSVVKCGVLCMGSNSGKSSGSGNGNEVGSTKIRVTHGHSDEKNNRLRRQQKG